MVLVDSSVNLLWMRSIEQFLTIRVDHVVMLVLAIVLVRRGWRQSWEEEGPPLTRMEPRSGDTSAATSSRCICRHPV